MTSERRIQSEILLAVGSRPGVRLWRQQCGRVPVLDPRDVRRALTLGLRVRYMQLAPPGAADLCGLMADGRMLQVECKSPTGRVRPEQTKWREIIEKYRGIYILARSAEEAVEQLP